MTSSQKRWTLEGGSRPPARLCRTAPGVKKMRNKLNFGSNGQLSSPGWTAPQLGSQWYPAQAKATVIKFLLHLLTGSRILFNLCVNEHHELPFFLTKKKKRFCFPEMLLVAFRSTFVMALSEAAPLFPQKKKSNIKRFHFFLVFNVIGFCVWMVWNIFSIGQISLGQTTDLWKEYL